MVGFSPSWSCIYVVVGMIDDDKNSGWLVSWLVDSISLPIMMMIPLHIPRLVLTVVSEMRWTGLESGSEPE